MPNRSTTHALACKAACVVATLMLAGFPAPAQTPPVSEPDEPVPAFAAAYMRDAKVIAVGKDVWQQQCRHCHGNSAYPGKAPKLSAGSMDPVFIFDRVTYGFKGMPPWRHVFTREQRMALVAYIKSDGFSP